ncbi:MAG: hypothetical protein IK085_02440 [Clostridia bacterium]|nr:hypothetical protein [Clostridia bacterium]MBR6005501.1 hypothetical protein [Clostridia bacterium]
MNKAKDILNSLSQVPLATWVRLVFLALSIANLALRSLGFDTMRFSDSEVSSAVSIALAAVSALAAYWKNNSFTSAALEADRVLAEMKKKA